MGKHSATIDTIPAAVLDELITAAEFADAADTAVEITSNTMELRRAEFDEARAAAEKAEDLYWAAVRARDLATTKLVSLQRLSGVVRTADGWRLPE